MGKGTINSHTGEGLYNVTLNLDKTRIITELASLAIMISACETLIATITSEISSLETEIASINPFTQSDLYKLKTQELNQKKNKKNVLVIKKASCEARQKYLLNNTPVDPEITAWCADKTTTLSGEVGIIEVPGERKTIVNIQPGYAGNAVYNATRDGQLQPAISGNTNNVFYNWSMLAGWQKWMPTYRYGAITSIDTEEHTCNVTLEAATSSVLDEFGNPLNVNAVNYLEDVPIKYMDVDDEAFAVDDVVLIKFDSVKEDVKNADNWANCTVIGFKDHPKYPSTRLPLVYEAWDYDWDTLLGYAFADSTGKPIAAGALPASPEPTFATKYVSDLHVDSILLSTEYDPEGYAIKHYQLNLVLNDIVMKTSYYTRYYVYMSYYDVGTEIYLGDEDYGGYLDEDHYIYSWYEQIYDDDGDIISEKNYLTINDVDTVMRDRSINPAWYYSQGYTLPESSYTNGAAIFVNGTDVYYVYNKVWSTTTVSSGTWQWEVFYQKNDEDLIKWVSPEVPRDDRYAIPLGFQLGGEDAYCWDGLIGIIAE